MLTLKLSCTFIAVLAQIEQVLYFILEVWNDCGHILRVFALLPHSPDGADADTISSFYSDFLFQVNVHMQCTY